MEITKVEHIDFTIKEDEYEKIIFRFLPRESHCHSFGDEPPTCWRNVYKVYYAYEIFVENYFIDEVQEAYSCHCDECSIIDEVAYICHRLSESEKEVMYTDEDDETYTVKLLDNEHFPTGYGTSWIVRESWNGMFCFELFKWNNVGYRFFLEKSRLKEFGDYLMECCEYMLAHGEPI